MLVFILLGSAPGLMLLVGVITTSAKGGGVMCSLFSLKLQHSKNCFFTSSGCGIQLYFKIGAKIIEF